MQRYDRLHLFNKNSDENSKLLSKSLDVSSPEVQLFPTPDDTNQLILLEESEGKLQEQREILSNLIAYVRGQKKVTELKDVITQGDGKPDFTKILSQLDYEQRVLLQAFLEERHHKTGFFSPNTFKNSFPATVFFTVFGAVSASIGGLIVASIAVLGYNIFTQYNHQSLVKERVEWLLSDLRGPGKTKTCEIKIAAHSYWYSPINGFPAPLVLEKEAEETAKTMQPLNT